MRKSIHPEPRDASALRFLAELEAGEGGYEFHEVRGWALREDVERATRARLPERLPRLHARGFLDRADVRVPGTQRPRWIWRINPLGADLVGISASLVHGAPGAHPNRASQDSRVYIPPRSLRALQLLRAAMRTARAEYIVSEPGWRTMSQLLRSRNTAETRGAFNDFTSQARGEAEAGEEWRGTNATEEWIGTTYSDPLLSRWDPLHGATPGDPYVGDRFAPDDVYWLVKVGFAQVWPLAVPWRAMPVTLYRVTPAGASTVPLDWALPHGRP